MWSKLFGASPAPATKETKPKEQHEVLDVAEESDEEDQRMPDAMCATINTRKTKQPKEARSTGNQRHHGRLPKKPRIHYKASWNKDVLRHSTKVTAKDTLKTQDRVAVYDKHRRAFCTGTVTAVDVLHVQVTYDHTPRPVWITLSHQAVRLLSNDNVFGESKQEDLAEIREEADEVSSDDDTFATARQKSVVSAKKTRLEENNSNQKPTGRTSPALSKPDPPSSVDTPAARTFCRSRKPPDRYAPLVQVSRGRVSRSLLSSKPSSLSPIKPAATQPAPSVTVAPAPVSNNLSTAADIWNNEVEKASVPGDVSRIRQGLRVAVWWPDRRIYLLATVDRLRSGNDEHHIVYDAHVASDQNLGWLNLGDHQFRILFEQQSARGLPQSASAKHLATAKQPASKKQSPVRDGAVETRDKSASASKTVSRPAHQLLSQPLASAHKKPAPKRRRKTESTNDSSRVPSVVMARKQSASLDEPPPPKPPPASVTMTATKPAAAPALEQSTTESTSKQQLKKPTTKQGIPASGSNTASISSIVAAKVAAQKATKGKKTAPVSKARGALKTDDPAALAAQKPLGQLTKLTDSSSSSASASSRVMSKSSQTESAAAPTKSASNKVTVKPRGITASAFAAPAAAPTAGQRPEPRAASLALLKAAPNACFNQQTQMELYEFNQLVQLISRPGNAAELVEGARVAVWWPTIKRYFLGVVDKIDQSREATPHHVEYDSFRWPAGDDTGWADLNVARFLMVSLPPESSSPANASQAQRKQVSGVSSVTKEASMEEGAPTARWSYKQPSSAPSPEVAKQPRPEVVTTTEGTPPLSFRSSSNALHQDSEVSKQGSSKSTSLSARPVVDKPPSLPKKSRPSHVDPSTTSVGNVLARLDPETTLKRSPWNDRTCAPAEVERGGASTSEDLRVSERKDKSSRSKRKRIDDGACSQRQRKEKKTKRADGRGHARQDETESKEDVDTSVFETRSPLALPERNLMMTSVLDGDAASLVKTINTAEEERAIVQALQELYQLLTIADGKGGCEICIDKNNRNELSTLGLALGLCSVLQRKFYVHQVVIHASRVMGRFAFFDRATTVNACISQALDKLGISHLLENVLSVYVLGEEPGFIVLDDRLEIDPSSCTQEDIRFVLDALTSLLKFGRKNDLNWKVCIKASLRAATVFGDHPFVCQSAMELICQLHNWASDTLVRNDMVQNMCSADGITVVEKILRTHGEVPHIQSLGKDLLKIMKKAKYRLMNWVQGTTRKGGTWE